MLVVTIPRGPCCALFPAGPLKNTPLDLVSNGAAHKKEDFVGVDTGFVGKVYIRT
jgi:hypothetical protein